MSMRGTLTHLTTTLGIATAGLVGAPEAGAAFTEISSFGTFGGGTGQLTGPSNLEVWTAAACLTRCVESSLG